MNIHDAISAMVRRDETDKGTLTLGEVMDALRSLPKGSLVTINGKKPTSINSYRGYYEHLAIATDERQGGERSEVIEPYRGQYSYSNADAAEVLIGSCGVVDDLLNALALCIGALTAALTDMLTDACWRCSDGDGATCDPCLSELVAKTVMTHLRGRFDPMTGRPAGGGW